jgi:hypothetical protein
MISAAHGLFSLSVESSDQTLMIAIREIHEVQSGEVTITLPPDFRAKRVEIIILPLEEIVEVHAAAQAKEEQQQFQELLLKAPVLTADEFAEYDRIRKWINKWIVNDF